jgi:type IV pilus assembly protein PilA
MRSKTRARARPDHDGDDSGFTLIELMVVVLIIAILIAIAIPTFLGAQNRARDRAAQSDLRNALTTAKTIATDHQGFFLNTAGTKLVAADMPEGEPALTFDDATTSSSNPRTVFINDATDGSVITFVQRSASAIYFGISVTVDGDVTYCRGAALTDCDDGTLDAANYTDTW